MNQPQNSGPTFSKWRLRLEQIFIAILHFVLLSWMIATLQEAGNWPMTKVILHFIGMSCYGGLLIMSTAHWAKKRMHWGLEKKKF